MNKNPSCLLLIGVLALSLAENAIAAKRFPRYERGVRDAAVAESTEIAGDLVAVTSNNGSLIWNDDKTLVKVVTWKSQSSYENYILPYNETSSNEAFVIWVTMAPRIKEFCQNYLHSHPHAGPSNLDLRLKQRLGLHPEWQYDVFVEMWVDPTDIFRPCVDPDPSDSTCNLEFGSTDPAVKNIQDYTAFYKDLYFTYFRATPGVPWTGLGYTYDWGHPHHEEGESEFILSPGTPYQIEQAVPTWQYCSQ